MITVLIRIELIMAQRDAMTIYMAQNDVMTIYVLNFLDKLIITAQCTFLDTYLYIVPIMYYILCQ